MGDSAQTLVDSYLTPMLGVLQRLTVYDEIGRILASNLVRFAYGNWLTGETPEVLLNRAAVSAGYTINKTRGEITFTDPSVQTGDEVISTYMFSYFTNDDMIKFLTLALSDINNVRPRTSFTFETADEDWRHSLVENAYTRCLRVLIMDATNFRARLIFADPASLLNYLQAELSHYNSSYMEWRKQIKGRRYLTPRSISSGRWRRPATPTSSSWQDFTVIRG